MYDNINEYTCTGYYCHDCKRSVISFHGQAKSIGERSHKITPFNKDGQFMFDFMVR